MKDWTKEKFLTARGYAIRNKKNDDLSASMEDYLEMIYRLSLDEGYTRVNDIASALNVQAPSVTKMIRKLNEKNYVNYEKYGIIKLTSSGKNLGKYLLTRHNTIYKFLEILDVKKNLHENVEGIEHNIDENTLECILTLVNFFNDFPEINNKLKKYQRNKK
jgi:Mn-dependent DtxR family transcriptional regulator